MAKVNLVERTKRLLASGAPVKSAIAKQTQALYDAIEIVKTPEAAESLLAQSESFLKLAKRRLQGDTEAVNEIQRGRFALMALIASLFPPEQGKRTDKEATSRPPDAKLSRSALTDYRRVLGHLPLMDAYFASLTQGRGEGEPPSEASLASFLRHVQAESRKTQSAEYDASRASQNARLAYHAPDDIKAIHDAPAILVGPAWWRGDRDYDWLEDFVGWKLVDRLDKAGGFILFRTLGHNLAKGRADALLLQWGAKPLPWQIIVTGTHNEELVIGTTGGIEPEKYLPAPDDPTQPHVVLVKCPRNGIESLADSWTSPWAEERGTSNLQVEVMATEDHTKQGWQYHPWEPASC